MGAVLVDVRVSLSTKPCGRSMVRLRYGLLLYCQTSEVDSSIPGLRKFHFLRGRVWCWARSDSYLTNAQVSGIERIDFGTCVDEAPTRRKAAYLWFRSEVVVAVVTMQWLGKFVPNDGKPNSLVRKTPTVRRWNNIRLVYMQFELSNCYCSCFHKFGEDKEGKRILRDP